MKSQNAIRPSRPENVAWAAPAWARMSPAVMAMASSRRISRRVAFMAGLLSGADRVRRLGGSARSGAPVCGCHPGILGGDQVEVGPIGVHHVQVPAAERWVDQLIQVC